MAGQRSVFAYLVIASLCLVIGFMMGHSQRGDRIVIIGAGKGNNGQLIIPLSANISQLISDASPDREDPSQLADISKATAKDSATSKLTMINRFQNKDSATSKATTKDIDTPKATTINRFDLHQPTKDRHECVRTRWKPSFTMCIHPIDTDIRVSKSVKETGIWESNVLRPFQTLLTKHPTMGVIDLGANIGQYALLGVAMGRPVVAVEARLLHVQMIHHAVIIDNRTDSNFVLLHNAVSDDHSPLRLRLMTPRNQGHTEVVGENQAARGIPVHEVSVVPAVLMDDLLQVVHFDKAIIKIDIEGYEYKAIAHCEQLFSKIYVPYMFMEWLFYKKAPGQQPIIVNTLTKLGYTAFDLKMKRLDKQSMSAWPWDIIWKHENATF